MNRDDVLFFFGFPVLGLLLVAGTFMFVFGLSFGLRDAFCYPEFKEWFIGAAFEMGVIAAPFLAGMTLFAYRRFRKIWLHVIFAFVPLALYVTAFGSAIAGELAAIEVSRAHCAAAPYPEAGDNDAPTSPATAVFLAIAKYSALGFLLSLVLAPIIGALPERR